MSYGEKIMKEMEESKDLNATSNSDWFKFKEGTNKIRVLSEPAILFEDFKMGMCYHDCGFQGSPKFLTYILDRADGKVKPFKLPNTINDQIIALEESERFSFNGFPMPYDLEIKAVGAGTKEVKYSVLAGIEKPVNINEDQLPKKTPIELVDILKKKNQEKHEKDGTRAKILADRASLKKELDLVRGVDDKYPTPEDEGIDVDRDGFDNPVL